LISGQENKIGEVTVTADAAGNIKVKKITFNASVTGIAGVDISSLRVANGNTTISDTVCVFFVCTFTNGYTISAGTSQTFNLYGTVIGTFGSAGVSVVSTSVSSSGFLWDDVLGGATNLTGHHIYNFPTNSYSLRN
jgi:hypothetical protein